MYGAHPQKEYLNKKSDLYVGKDSFSGSKGNASRSQGHEYFNKELYFVS